MQKKPEELEFMKFPGFFN